MTVLAAFVLALQTPEPGPENFREWVRFIQPDSKEQAYKEIDWRTSLREAMNEARALGRPILLWTMNGHPMGCT
ncbi:MAG: hypothetical protein KF884_08135 [Fimbriimonadaceae bacterium]|nr:hypothetical protein [Fimbriimonadaceae bacterium]QYK57519.1 MAG: hypothetical protein KF884_08135 [Fimbriimonadaceae bacterium]